MRRSIASRCNATAATSICRRRRCEVVDEQGKTVAHIRKTLYIRRKQPKTMSVGAGAGFQQLKMRPNSSNRRIAPRRQRYQRRNRRLLIPGSGGIFVLWAPACGGLPRIWDCRCRAGTPRAARRELSLEREEREALQTQLDMLQTQWQRLIRLDALKNGANWPLQSRCCLALAAAGALGD